MKQNLVGKSLGKIKIFGQDFVPIRTALRASLWKKIRTHLDLLSIPQSEGKMSKRLVGGFIGCKGKTSSWHLNGFPNDVNVRLSSRSFSSIVETFQELLKLYMTRRLSSINHLKCVLELFNSQEILDGSSVPRERGQARAGWVKGIFVIFRPLKYLPTYF